MKNIGSFVWVVIFVLSLIGCRPFSGDIKDHSSEHPDCELTIWSPVDNGFDDQALSNLLDSIKTGYYPNRHSLLIYRDEQLVLEEYFPGHDENWGEDLGIVQHSDTTLHDMRSVSKSVVSACIGIAIAQGKIQSVDQPVFEFFGDYNPYNKDGREALTIKHLLTMTSGLKWNEDVPYDNPENSEIQMINSGDGIAFVLSRELVNTPGEVWQYNGGTTELLAEIIKRVSGMNIHEYAKEFLFEPLCISRSEWTISPATNSPAAASGLRLTSRDMLKFGILYLNEGRWDTLQIIPKNWVNESLMSHVLRPEGGGYGYQFWVLDFLINGKSMKIPAALGNGDQRIFIDRKNKLLLVTTAGNYNKWDIENNAGSILKKIYNSLDLMEE